jgi:hypothetical protein
MNDNTSITVCTALVAAAVFGILFSMVQCDRANAAARYQFLAECAKVHTPLECEASLRGRQ